MSHEPGTREIKEQLENVMAPYFTGLITMGPPPSDLPNYGVGSPEWKLYLRWAKARNITTTEMAEMMEARDFGFTGRNGNFAQLDHILQRTTCRR